MDFTNKVAISTGAASGMGLLFAENFAALGNCMSLCVHEYDELATQSQPLCLDMKMLRDLI